MQNIINFIQANMNFLNDIKAYHWQTKSYSEHENLQEFYEKFDELNDRFVETWQGRTHQRINFSAELRPGIMNYADNKQVCSEVCKTSDRINEIYKEVDGPDLHSILEDMLEQTSQLCFHLTLK